jgi:hypothetical protein
VRRTLRLLQPNPVKTSLRRPGGSAGIFWWAVLAIFLQFVVTNNLLQAAGVTAPLKVHPSSLIGLFCVIYLLLRDDVPLQVRFRKSPGLMLFVFGIPLVGLYAIAFNGYSGSMVYIESFWSAGLLTITLESVTDRRKRLLAKILIALCVIDAFVGIYESLTYTNWFPMVLDPDLTEKMAQTDVDFRANAFYGHPLSASLVTAMAIFLIYSMRMRFLVASPIFAVLLIALFAFGGRTALGVTVIASLGYAFHTLLSGILKRDLKLDFVLAVVVAAIAIPIFVTIIVTQTTIADRIMNTLYYDDSAQVRTTQWEILGKLSLRNWLFGISLVDLSALKYQIGLGSIDTDIENFWLLTFLNLGTIAFIPFLCLFGGFLVHIARRTSSLNGWLLMFSALIIESASNSLGVKSNDLFLEAAFMVAMAGYIGVVRVPRRRAFSRSLAGNRAHGAIADSPQRAIDSGLRVRMRPSRTWGLRPLSETGGGPNVRPRHNPG